MRRIYPDTLDLPHDDRRKSQEDTMHAKYHDNTISLIFDAANTRRHW